MKNNNIIIKQRRFGMCVYLTRIRNYPTIHYTPQYTIPYWTNPDPQNLEQKTCYILFSNSTKGTQNLSTHRYRSTKKIKPLIVYGAYNTDA